jgi:hypothetical protein
VIVDGGVDRPRFRVEGCEDGIGAGLWDVTVFDQSSGETICTAMSGGLEWRYGDRSQVACASLVVGRVYRVLIFSDGPGVATGAFRATDGEWQELENGCSEDRWLLNDERMLKPQHLITRPLQPSLPLSLGVELDTLRVVAAVDFNDQPNRRGQEIDHEVADDNLPTKGNPELFRFDMAPQGALRGPKKLRNLACLAHQRQ